jgi:hypothetical protein
LGFSTGKPPRSTKANVRWCGDNTIYEAEIWSGDQKLGTQSFKVIDLNTECEQECGGF